jgi:hypothetical protein
VLNIRIILLPKSRMGKWSVWLSLFFILTSIFFYIFAELLKVITSDMLVSIFGTAAIIIQIIALIFGVIVVAKHKEYSSLVFLVILIGLVVLGFIFGDILGLPDI